ncbi:HAMP domain-containing histidine kinase [Mucilaginibacter robiniae]|uniref:histidine kinase n=1 Tax=Mucilaginibacter robiniae TaxID=2728022 RepID=A0A7L5E3V3_9SPHI|nr:HAMP domain-containing sensor histidine kinase [Mucilaginibacter robiniae]QJD95026.1 HAMP domain-containing histidine kinase [Mucilaginibacter robiniae]
MKSFFFKKIYSPCYTDFQNYYTLQNLEAIRNGSLVFFILNAGIRLFYILFPEGFRHAPNIVPYNITNWIFVSITPLFFIGSQALIKNYRHKSKATVLTLSFTLAFALYIILSGMVCSFIAMHNPRNTLTLYLIGLLSISVLCVFEYLHALLLTITTGAFFTIFLFYVKHDAAERIYNEITSIIVLSTFYLISRYIYTFKANHYNHLNEITQKNSEIEKASRFKTEVLGMVAHDLRNPIGAIESLTMMMELDELDDDMQDNVNMIKASCVKARTIINDLLDVARNEDPSLMELVHLDVNELLLSFVKDWNSRKNSNEVVFIAPDYPLYADINPEKFHRVIDNLVSNAMKFSVDGGKIEIHLHQQNKYIYIEVKDYGMGIPQHMLPYIFDRFSKAGRTGIRGEQSTGLGLSIVRQIVENHHGKIEVSSTENQGSSFKIQLPQPA